MLRGGCTGELLHRRLPGVADPLPLQDLPDRHGDNPNVQPQRLVVHVPHIQPEFLLPTDGVAAVDLGPAGDPWPHLMAPRLLRGVAPQVLHQKRPRPHQAHISFEDVEQLRQLIEAGGPQEAAEGGQARRVGEEGAVGTAGVGHGAELEEQEGTAVQTGTLLAEQHRAAQSPPDGRRKQQERWE